MHKKIALFSAIAIATIPFAPAFAVGEQMTQTKAQETKEERIKNRTLAIEEKQEARSAKALQFQDRKEKMEEAKCKNLENKIANRVKRYENNGNMLSTVYGNMQTRLARLLERLNTAKADTAKLTADLAILDGKIAKLKTDHATFMTTLKDSQSFVCGSSEGEFKNKLEEARKVPEIIKQDRQDIKDFFQTTIKADLKEIRTALAEEKEATEPEDDEKDKDEAPTPVSLP
ncbi:MAG: hypothetical protein ACD_8C00050G0002 [uncultured bacterium]|nr:MAG: hypothetical protein ACD_8C00050G0002 [uncultured bacterium]